MVGAEDSMRAWLSNKTVRHFLKIYSTVFLCVFIVTAVACAVFVRYSYRDSVKLVREQLTESVQRLNREIFTVTETATNLASNYQVVLLANTQLPFSRRQTFMVKNAITQFSEGFKFQSIMENYGLIMKNGGVLRLTYRMALARAAAPAGAYAPRNAGTVHSASAPGPVTHGACSRSVRP